MENCRPARPRTQHCYHHDTNVKSEAATAIIELLMMGGRRPETCSAVNKRQDYKLENYCIRLVIYLNCTMMHGLTNLKEIQVYSFHRDKEQSPREPPVKFASPTSDHSGAETLLMWSILTQLFLVHTAEKEFAKAIIHRYSTG